MTLSGYSDAALWAELPWTQSLRLHELSARDKQGLLSETEQADRYMLLRSEALLLLKQRGQNIDTYLKMRA